MSLFISFEGGEGSGKSTQAEALRRRLEQDGALFLGVREPGTTPLGRYLRDWLKREKPREEVLSDRAELFLFAAARAELVDKIIKPALEHRNMIVISDRYADSSVAYQAYGRGLDFDEVNTVNRLATGGLMPDLTFLLDCPPQRGLGRISTSQMSFDMISGTEGGAGRLDAEGFGRFEGEPLEFHEKVRDGYLELAKSEPERWLLIDAMLPVDQIADIVWAEVRRRLPDGLSVSGEGDLTLPLFADSVEG